ncbi:GlsB/YeaQ/YmgE family stress response membrane protein [Umezawaea sp. NPDC059074]|uniref:GlsB/YeaQ/YmgE family stress response membrane protein n=1 Tax=Umezawaea sp. NPDC059074 TaxID=3346716 RepID=UPI00369DEDEA
MGVLGWIVLGLIAGAIAKAIMPGKDPGGIIVTMLIGIVGAVIGGFVGKALFGTDISTFFSLSTWLLAILGSLILLGIYRLVTGRRAHA